MKRILTSIFTPDELGPNLAETLLLVVLFAVAILAGLSLCLFSR